MLNQDVDDMCKLDLIKRLFDINEAKESRLIEFIGFFGELSDSKNGINT